jgi:signal transduction histidine kinase
LVLLRNPKIRSSIYFFCLSVSISLWTVTNYLTEANIPLSLNIFFNSLAYLFGYLCLVFITLFCFNFPENYSLNKRKKIILITIFVLFGLLSLTQLVAGTVTKGQDGLHFQLGPLSTLYSLVLVLLLIVSTVRLIKTMKRSNLRVKKQIRLIIMGFVLSVVLGVLTNVLIPSLASNFETAKFGPLLTVFLVASSTYAIVRYGLFDIRLIVARSAAYILAIATLTAGYSFLVFGFTRGVFHHNSTGLSGAEQVINTVVILFLALSFRTLKKFFDRISNNLFYRDNYDAQIFLDQLNNVLVTNIELKPLLTTCAGIISTNLKSEFCNFVIKSKSDNEIKQFGTLRKDFDPNILKQARQESKKIFSKVLITDFLPEKARQLQENLRAQNTALVVSLVTNTHQEGEGLGYMVIGPKKSGNTYNKQDIRILEIIANELVIATQNALRFEEIENFAATLQEKVDDATRQLRSTNEKLKQLDQTKDDFISMASHQLRTPLTSVKGYVSMVMEGDAGKISAQQRKLLDQAFVSSQRMVYLIADLLNVSRLRTGKFIIEAKPTNLADVVEGEIAQLTETAKGRGLELTYTKPKDFPELMLDDTKIRQVIMNFADNAIYYTPAGGHIQVGLENKGDSIEFTVTDDGIGVPKAEEHHLFNKFYRAGNAKKARPDGTGLGLFMAKKVIIAQGGAIIFKTQEGKGSTFGFSFAKAALSPAHYKPPKDVQIAKSAEPAAK